MHAHYGYIHIDFVSIKNMLASLPLKHGNDINAILQEIHALDGH